MNTLAHPPLRLLERRPARAAMAPPVTRPTLLQRLEAWVERLPEPTARHHRLGSWMTMR